MDEKTIQPAFGRLVGGAALERHRAGRRWRCKRATV